MNPTPAKPRIIIAHVLGSGTPATPAARFHLRTALARTGARTQAELVRIAVRVLRDFRLRQQNAGQDVESWPDPPRKLLTYREL